jgi:CRP/FNR family transcriptional regulator
MPGETILKQGSYVSQVVYLKSGVLKIVLESKNNKSTILKIEESDSLVALPVLSVFKIYPFSVIAITQCEICLIRKEAIQEIMDRNIKANQFLVNWYSKEYSYIYTKILTISTRNNHGKLASALLYLSNGNFKKNVLNLISRKDLADLASISIDSTNKILMELKNDKIIEINKKGIKILNHELIEKLSTVG